MTLFLTWLFGFVLGFVITNNILLRTLIKPQHELIENCLKELKELLELAKRQQQIIKGMEDVAELQEKVAGLTVK